jgi:hypothetical protein
VQTIFLTIGFLESNVLVGAGLEVDVFNFILIVKNYPNSGTHMTPKFN